MIAVLCEYFQHHKCVCIKTLYKGILYLAPCTLFRLQKLKLSKRAVFPSKNFTLYSAPSHLLSAVLEEGENLYPPLPFPQLTHTQARNWEAPVWSLINQPGEEKGTGQVCCTIPLITEGKESGDWAGVNEYRYRKEQYSKNKGEQNREGEGRRKRSHF